MGFRVGLNVADSNVIDVGYAGVIGADRIVDGDHLYGPGFSDDVERGDTYGPATYLAYVPFEQAMPWSGAWDDLPAAHGAALAFDLLTLAGLILLGRRLRPGPEGRVLGYALGFAWAAYPVRPVLPADELQRLAGGAAHGGRDARRSRWPARGRRGSRRGAAVALAAAAKFAPLALAPLFATARGRTARGAGSPWRLVGVLVAAFAAVPARRRAA